jgi:hypothetical protein
MSDEIKKPEEITDVPSPELTKAELERVAGGRDKSAPSISEIVVTKPTDIATP